MMIKWLIKWFCPFLFVMGQIIRHTSLTYWFNEVNKDNWFNKYIVKKGWFWNTLIIFYYQFKILNDSNRGTTKFKFFLLRYFLITTAWYVFTQKLIWGTHLPPLMDLIFMVTGGSCRFDLLNKDKLIDPNFQSSSKRLSKSITKILSHLPIDNDTANYLKCLQENTNNKDNSIQNIATMCQNNLNYIQMNKEIQNTVNEKLIKMHKINNWSSQQCRAFGGNWSQGHDPSGHLFLLTLMIMMILGEINLQYRTSKKHCKNGTKTKPNMENKLKLKSVSHKVYQSLRLVAWEQPNYLLIGVLLLWCWSYVVTINSFHTFTEQLSGSLPAYLFCIAVYERLV